MRARDEEIRIVGLQSAMEEKRVVAIGCDTLRNGHVAGRKSKCK